VLSDPDLDLDVEILGTSARAHLTHGVVKQLAFRLDGPAEYHWKCPVQEPPRNAIPDSTTFAIIPMAPDAYAAFEKTTRGALNPTTREGKIELGKKLYEKKGCVACHTVDGSARVGPSWAHIWGTSVAAGDGTTRTVDADFVRESVLHPTAFAAAGYPPAMPSFEGQLKPIELESLTAYIESLQ
jgi:mono/diheme cytochrome c family protein